MIRLGLPCVPSLSSFKGIAAIRANHETAPPIILILNSHVFPLGKRPNFGIVRTFLPYRRIYHLVWQLLKTLTSVGGELPEVFYSGTGQTA